MRVGDKVVVLYSRLGTNYLEGEELEIISINSPDDISVRDKQGNGYSVTERQLVLITDLIKELL